MGKKPTYEELEQRVKKLTNESLKVDQMVIEAERIFNFSMDMIGSGNLQGYFTKINSSFGKTLGYSEKEILEYPFINFVHNDDVEKTKQALADAVKGKKEIYIVNRYKCKDGSHKWIEWKVLSIVKENKFIAVGREVTKRKRVEEKLQESKAMFQAIVESLPFDVFALDRNNHYILQNSICRKNWGDLIGKSPENVAVDKNTNDLWLKNNRLALSGETVTDEVIYDRLNGDKGYYYNIVSPIIDKEEIFGILGILIDISELKKTEKALRESMERFRDLTETTSDWVWEVDKDSRYTYVSPKIRDVLGYYPDEIIGKTPFDLMSSEEADRVSKIFDVIRATKRPFHCLENINLHKKGHHVVLETSGVPIVGDDGELSGYRGIDRNITQRKKAENELRKYQYELENRVKERTRELEIQKSNLEEANIVLQVLLEKRLEDKKEMEDNVLTNVKEMIAPYVKKLKKIKLNDQQNALLNIIESNLNEIISPFSRKMSLKYLNLTPAEIHVANLIRHGINSKEIAELMGLSPQTIYNHRKNIRKKFGLEKQKTNLRSHLLSIY